MAHDDFMYTRQEQPRSEFVSDLQAKLQQETPKDQAEQSYQLLSFPSFSKRKKGKPTSRMQRFLQVAASIAVILLPLFAILPDTRMVIADIFGVQGWLAVSDDDAQDYLQFMIPQDIPEGYTRQVVWTDRDGNTQEGDVLIHSITTDPQAPIDIVVLSVFWWNDESDCSISLRANDNLNSEDVRISSMARNEHYAERYDWMEAFDIADERAFWRWETSPSYDVPRMTIEWTVNNTLHHLETSSDCMTQQDFIALAQSAQ